MALGVPELDTYSLSPRNSARSTVEAASELRIAVLTIIA